MTDSGSPPPGRTGLLAGLNRQIITLGAVSLFTDIASEMIVPIRIIFLVLYLGTPLPIAGLIEGIAEGMSSLLKIVSGRLADRMTERKPLLIVGYGLSAVAKPLLALVAAWPAALGLIVTDRVGKGVRSSPRDAMLADATTPAYRGKAFGFHRAMDTLGAAIGPLLTVLIVALSAGDQPQALSTLRRVFVWAAVPGVLSLIALSFLHERPTGEVSEVVKSAPAIHATGKGARVPVQALGSRFWLFTAVATLFALANASDAFIFLRTAGLEYAFSPLEAVPLLYCGYNIVYALLSTPLGALSDRWGRLPILLLGYGTFAAVYVGWAFANQGWHIWLLFLCYGIYAAATEGVGKALVTDLVPRAQRGAALGWFGGLTGAAALPANVLAGWLWATFRPSATFAVDAGIAAFATVLLLLCVPRLRHDVAVSAAA